MRISIWPYSSNPLTDPRIYKQSLSRCEESVAAGFLRWIDPADKSKGCVTVPARESACVLSKEELQAAAHETSVAASITEAEMKANAGVSDSEGEIARARLKVKAWLHPSTADRKAPLPRGSWFNPQAIRVVVVQ